jgi:hypothetical protein
MDKSKSGAILTFLLFCGTAFSESLSSSFKGSRMLKRQNSSFFGEINIADFPKCAYTNCITSDQLDPSRLGCVEPELTPDCLCSQAPTPLSCSPEGPSDQDNCWYLLEDWFAGTCNRSVPLIDRATMPECIQDCVLNFLGTEGCHAPTRNCFCILPRAPLIQAATSCYSANCTKKKESSFSPLSWHDNICDEGSTADYDQAGYDGHLSMVHSVRVSMAVIVGITSVVLVVIGICLCASDDSDGVAPIGAGLIFVAIALVLLIIVPVYTAL